MQELLRSYFAPDYVVVSGNCGPPWKFAPEAGIHTDENRTEKFIPAPRKSNVRGSRGNNSCG